MVFVFPVNTRDRSKFFDEQALKSRTLIQESHARDDVRQARELEQYSKHRSPLSISMTYKEELKRVLHQDSLNESFSFFNSAVKSEYIGHQEEKNNIERAGVVVAACRSLKERGAQPGMADLAHEVWKTMKDIGKTDQEATALAKAVQHFQNTKESPTIKALNEQTRQNLHAPSSASAQPKTSKPNQSLKM